MHFVKKPEKVPLALCHVVDFSHLNYCLIQDQPQVFPKGEIRQQLGVVVVHGLVWVYMDALAAYFHTKVAKGDLYTEYQ